MRGARVGIAIENDDLVAVRLRRREAPVTFHDVHDSGESWEAALARVLDGVGARRNRASVMVAVRDERVRRGLLFGTSVSSNEREVRAQFHAAPASFFWGVPQELVPGEVWREADSWHGIVADRNLVSSVERSVVEARSTLRGITTADSHESLAEAAESAAGLPERALPIVDASRVLREASARQYWRRSLWATVLVAAVATSLLPLLALQRRLESAKGRVEQARTQRDVEQKELGDSTISLALLTRLSELARTRGAVRTGLIALTEALPDSTAIASLHLEPTTGRAEIVSVDAAGSIVQLATRSELSKLRVLGAISSEVYAGARLGRVRIGWGDATQAVSRAPRILR